MTFFGVKKPVTCHLQRQSSRLPPSSVVVLPCSRCPTIAWRCWVSEQRDRVHRVHRVHGWSIGTDWFGFTNLLKAAHLEFFQTLARKWQEPCKMLFPGWSAYPSLYLCTGPAQWACLRRAARLDNTLSVQDHDRLEAEVLGKILVGLGNTRKIVLRGNTVLLCIYSILQENMKLAWGLRGSNNITTRHPVFFAASHYLLPGSMACRLSSIPPRISWRARVCCSLQVESWQAESWHATSVTIL